MTVNELIDALYCYNGNTEITILETKDNVTQWRSLEPSDFETIKCGDKRVMRLAPHIAWKIQESNPQNMDFYIG